MVQHPPLGRADFATLHILFLHILFYLFFFSSDEIRLRNLRLCSPREAGKKDICRQLDSPQHIGSGTSDSLLIPMLNPNFHLNTIFSPADSYGYFVNDNVKTTGQAPSPNCLHSN